LFAACCFVFIAEAQNDIVVDANASVRNLTGQFDAIKVSGGIDLYLSQADNVAIAVIAGNENYKEGIKTVIEDGTLKIFYKGENSWRKKDRKMRYVSFKDIKLGIGACDVIFTVSVLFTAIQMSGACDFSGSVKAVLN
jgi:hypothetical protein